MCFSNHIVHASTHSYNKHSNDLHFFFPFFSLSFTSVEFFFLITIFGTDFVRSVDRFACFGAVGILFSPCGKGLERSFFFIHLQPIKGTIGFYGTLHENKISFNPRVWQRRPTTCVKNNFDDTRFQKNAFILGRFGSINFLFIFMYSSESIRTLWDIDIWSPRLGLIGKLALARFYCLVNKKENPMKGQNFFLASKWKPLQATQSLLVESCSVLFLSCSGDSLQALSCVLGIQL